MTSKPSSPRKYLHIFGAIIIGYFVTVGIIVPTWFLVRDKLRVTMALHHATSVRLEHFEHIWSDKGRVERIIATKNLAPADFHRVSDAFPLAPDVSILMPFVLETGCIFNPHHRIFIDDAEGHETIISVCFECDHYDINHGGTVITPFLWQHSLRAFFAKEGMPEDPMDDRHPQK